MKEEKEGKSCGEVSRSHPKEERKEESQNTTNGKAAGKRRLWVSLGEIR